MTRTGSDLSQQIEAILRETTARIVALLEGEREAMVESLKQALATLDSNLRSSADIPEALLASIPAPGAPSSASRRPPRSQWVRTQDVVVRLRELLQNRPHGARIADLRQETGFSHMQLHRALRKLREAGEVLKEGEMRRTVYRYVERPRARRTTSTRAQRPADTSRPTAKAKARARPGRASRVPTEEVRRAVHRALRRRKRGLPMSRLRDVTGYSDKQIHRAIVAMADEGLLERVGSGRNMRYVLMG